MPALQSLEIDLLNAAGAPNIDRLLDALAAWLAATRGTLRRLFVGLRLGWPDHRNAVARFVRGLPRFEAGLSEDSLFVFKSLYTVQYHHAGAAAAGGWHDHPR